MCAKSSAKTPATAKSKKSQTATIIDNRTGKSYEYPILKGTVGPDVVDIRKFYADTGMFTYDPGYGSTGSCSSTITYIDGEVGILQYRGYPIEQLAQKSHFLEVAYLLLSGELPSKKEMTEFENSITHHSMLQEQIQYFFRGFRRDSHPMAVMCAAVGSLAAFYHDYLDFADPHDRMIAAHRLISKIPTIAAWAYKYSQGQPFIYPRNDLDYAGNFLHMMFGTPCEEYKVNPVSAKALDRLFILHADHEQNASTSTVRLTGSSGANPFACIAAGIASLWGPAHGGANEAVLNMLMQIGHKKNIREFIKKAEDPKDPFRLMGFGHRVYKNYDPRAKIIRESCHAVLDELGIREEPLLDLAMEMERIALSDEYFIEHKLYPNVDFYSGIIYKALGIPPEMFTAMFAIARTVGWIAQWGEMMVDPETRIGRPRQRFMGAKKRDYVPVSKRK